MPRCRVTRRLHFNAAHRLYNPEFSEEWNRATFGKCANANFHGHNYELDVTVEGEIEPETGYVFDLTLLQTPASAAARRHVVREVGKCLPADRRRDSWSTYGVRRSYDRTRYSRLGKEHRRECRCGCGIRCGR